MANVPDVLHRVNAARVAGGALPLDDIRPGIKGNYEQCPLANSLSDVYPGVRVGAHTVTEIPRERAGAVASALGGTVESVNGKASIRLPYVMTEFVRQFDNDHWSVRRYLKRLNPFR